MERNRLYNRDHPHRESPESRKKSNRKYRISSYGLTQEQFDRLLDAQQHTCGMCHEPFEEGQLIHMDNRCMLPDGEGCPGVMAASPSTTRVVAVSGYCGSAEVDDFSVSPRCRCARRRPRGKIAGGTARDVREIQALGLEVTLARIPDPELDRPATTPAA